MRVTPPTVRNAFSLRDVPSHAAPSMAQRSADVFDAAPAAFAVGDAAYYRERVQDFRARNPTLEPPPYYLDYGDRYAQRFLELGNLSAAGRRWRDQTLRLLQQSLEDTLHTDPEGFAALERNPEAFRRFAFATHPDAYVRAGIFTLPLTDLVHIMRAVRLHDWMSPEGRTQLSAFLREMDSADMRSVLRATELYLANLREGLSAAATARR